MSRWYHRLLNLRRNRVLSAETHAEAALVTFLAGQIALPARAAAVLSTVEAFHALNRQEQSAELPRVYLLLEQYLTEVDPVRKLTRGQLRETVLDRFPILQSSETFRLIFEAPERQEVLLCQAFLLEAIQKATTVLGAGVNNYLTRSREWVARASTEASPPAELQMAGEEPNRPTDPDWLGVLARLSRELYQYLSRSLGEASDRIYDGSYTRVAHLYAGLETFPVIIRLLPDGLLDEQRIQSLSRHSAFARVQDALSDAQKTALDTATQLEAVLATVGEGIITVDAQGDMVLVNREIGRIFGYEQADLIGSKMSRLLTVTCPAVGDGGLPLADEATRWQITGQRFEAEGIRKDGSRFPIEVCINETLISGHQFYTAAVRDITARRKYERELVRAKEHAEEMARLKTVFVANVSHELRTPLAGIMGFAQVLGEEVSKEHREFTDLIHESGQRLLDTLNSVLEFARLEAGQVECRREEIDLADRLGQTVRLFHRAAADKNLRLTLLPSDEVITASLDPAYLDRIASVLLENAIKFTTQGGITVGIERDGLGIRIRVRDTGIGISPEFLPHLFEEFRQESVGLSRSHQGAGLGLAIAKRLVEAMGGEIRAESEIGKGATFLVFFPTTPDLATSELSVVPPHNAEHALES